LLLSVKELLKRYFPLYAHIRLAPGSSASSRLVFAFRSAVAARASHACSFTSYPLLSGRGVEF